MSITTLAGYSASGLRQLPNGGFVSPEGFFVHAVSTLKELVDARGFLVVCENGERYWAVGDDAFTLLGLATGAATWSGVMAHLVRVPRPGVRWGIDDPISVNAAGISTVAQTTFDATANTGAGAGLVTIGARLSQVHAAAPSFVLALPNTFLRGRGASYTVKRRPSEASLLPWGHDTNMDYIGGFRGIYGFTPTEDSHLSLEAMGQDGILVPAIDTGLTKRQMLLKCAIEQCTRTYDSSAAKRADFLAEVTKGLDALQTVLRLHEKFYITPVFQLKADGTLRFVKPDPNQRTIAGGGSCNYRNTSPGYLTSYGSLTGQPVMTQHGRVTLTAPFQDPSAWNLLPTDLIEIGTIRDKPLQAFIGQQPFGQWYTDSGELKTRPAGQPIAEYGQLFLGASATDGNYASTHSGVVDHETVNGVSQWIVDEATFVGANPTGGVKDWWNTARLPVTLAEQHGFAIRRAYSLLCTAMERAVTDDEIYSALPWEFVTKAQVTALRNA